MVHGPIGGIIYNEGVNDGVWSLFPSTPLEEWDTTAELNKFQHETLQFYMELKIGSDLTAKRREILSNCMGMHWPE